MSDRAKAGESFLTAQNSKLAQQLAAVQKHVATSRGSRPEYVCKLSSDI